MFDRTLFKKNSLAISVAVLSIVSLSSCGKSTSNTTNVTPQGTVQLENVKVGMPEATFKDATITFVVDSKPAASGQGKTQYLSRTYDKLKGQYIAQIKDGKCFALQSLYATAPITKDEALEVMKALLPADAPPQSKVDDSHMKKDQSELYEFGDKYTGILQYDKTGAKATAVTAFDLGANAVREGLNWDGKKQPTKPTKGGKGAAATTTTKTETKKEAPAAAETATETTTSTTTTP